jgi:hypothetical protein
MGEKWTPEHDRAVEDVKDLADAGYKPEPGDVAKQVEANRDATKDALSDEGKSED